MKRQKGEKPKRQKRRRMNRQKEKKTEEAERKKTKETESKNKRTKEDRRDRTKTEGAPLPLQKERKKKGEEEANKSDSMARKIVRCVAVLSHTRLGK